MSTTQRVPQTLTESDTLAELRRQYGCGPVEFAGTEDALYERHLVFDNVVGLAAAGPRERFEVFARSVRDIVEDLGLITPDVRALRDQFRMPGTRVLQFAFDGSSDNPYLRENYIINTGGVYRYP